MKRELSILFTLILAFQVVITGSAAATTLYVDDDGTGNYTTIQAAVNDAVDGDTIIVEPGTYAGDITIAVPDLTVISSDQYNAVIRASGNAFNLMADNIAVKNFDIIGPGSSSSYSGIVDNYFFCTIQNNKISNFNIGVGVYNFNGGGGGSIINNNIFDCGEGILLLSTLDNKISGNRISNCGMGIDMADSYGTLIYNNNFNNNINVQSAADSVWNTEKISGTNIIGGPYIGGNYWATPAGNGFSQTHQDTNGDGFAEEPYELDEENIDYLPLVTPKTEPAPVLPVANFRANTTYGSAPLSVAFTDLSQNAVSWRWDFNNNGKYDSVEQNPVFVYEYPANFTVNLTVINENGTSTKTAVITVLDKEIAVLPVANFSTNTTTGYSPLSVAFTDLSQNAASRSWDVDGDGIPDSGEANFVYVYKAAGTYTANLTVSNSNGTASKKATINVLVGSSSGGNSNEGSNDGGSSDEGGSSGGSSSGGGGGGGSPEPAKNVKVKEISQTYVKYGKNVKFDFTKNATCVVYISFDAKKNAGKTTTIVEELKGKSALVPALPDGEVYKSFNVWVGNSGFATPKNIENPVICFKVEKSWAQDKDVDEDSISLNRYSDKKWEQLAINLSGEDDEFLYFTAEVPGFSSFAITGKANGASANISGEKKGLETRALQGEGNETAGSDTGPYSEQKENMKFSDISPVYSIIGILLLSLICILIYRTLPK